MSGHTPEAWQVVKGALVLPSGDRMRASCHHRKSGACGGCYARFYVALDAIKDGAPVTPTIEPLFAAIRKEMCP